MIIWTFLIAFGIIQDSSAAANEIISNHQRFLHKTENQSAEVVCDFPPQREIIKNFNAVLLKGVKKTKIYSVKWNISSDTNQNSSEFSCNINATGKVKYATFHLRNLQVNHTDSYACKIEVIDPPPYQPIESNGTLIYVKEYQERFHDLNMATAIGLGMFIFYSIVITAAICYCWLKSKKSRALQKDYFNMTPWQSNGAMKQPPWQGVPVRNYTAYRSWEP